MCPRDSRLRKPPASGTSPWKRSTCAPRPVVFNNAVAIAGLYTPTAATDAGLWNFARMDALWRLLDRCPRFYHAAPSQGTALEREFDLWYITTYSRMGREEVFRFREDAIPYPARYTEHLDRLNRYIGALLLTLAGDKRYKALSKKPALVCLTGYLLLICEGFTSEIYEAWCAGQMCRGWRSKWLNQYLHRERAAHGHDADGRRHFLQDPEGGNYDTDPLTLSKGSISITSFLSVIPYYSSSFLPRAAGVKRKKEKKETK
ncbi:hypothetical protein K439DRAFT_1624649 [Ramaria rubella]|nr:hypothetical protein K439DRAFT_1624649 [Ramaria rubella]